MYSTERRYQTNDLGRQQEEEGGINDMRRQQEEEGGMKEEASDSFKSLLLD